MHVTISKVQSAQRHGLEVHLEGGQPKCLNHYEGQSDSDKEKKFENRKFEFEERGYFGTTKKSKKKFSFGMSELLV